MTYRLDDPKELRFWADSCAQQLRNTRLDASERRHLENMKASLNALAAEAAWLAGSTSGVTIEFNCNEAGATIGRSSASDE